jgi:hypothetical protein
MWNQPFFFSRIRNTLSKVVAGRADNIDRPTLVLSAPD